MHADSITWCKRFRSVRCLVTGNMEEQGPDRALVLKETTVNMCMAIMSAGPSLFQTSVPASALHLRFAFTIAMDR
jgi:hypothetical protein